MQQAMAAHSRALISHLLVSLPVYARAVQTQCLSLSRSCQRGVLDASDSLSLLHTLESPVTRSMADVASRTAQCVSMLRGLEADRRAEVALRARSAAEQMDDALLFDSAPPSSSVFHRHDVSLANTAAPSLAGTPRRPGSAMGGAPMTPPAAGRRPSLAATPSHATASMLRGSGAAGVGGSSGVRSLFSSPRAMRSPSTLRAPQEEGEDESTPPLDALHAEHVFPAASLLAAADDADHMHVPEQSDSAFVP